MFGHLDLKRMLAYPLTSVPLNLAHYGGLKVFTDKSTLFSKLDVRILTDAFRNVDVCMYCQRKIQSHVDLSSAFGGVANATLSRLARRANRVDFACSTYKYLSINDITREYHGLVWGDVNVSGSEQRLPKILYSSFKVRLI